MTDLEQDMKARWRPSAEQIHYADALLVAGASKERPQLNRQRGVHTIHLLINKEWGIWTEDVALYYLDGYFLAREAAWRALHASAVEYRAANPTTTVSGGYTWHSAPGQWAVFEDIGSSSLP